ncbi:TetR-family transcriptional regulator [Sphingobium herbicidovorans NBRC 16415]|uniref:TetR-family transcriptional regulator n=1 Tax=Sphingobium herbicidovorans (strain ATCC 700291 / DSM 11019 / CCUG 56400 / KCTC 2939 / LMG 18315 / NBRC 16415 / MH) TaxID=1219045 RepID=A0A086P657_SPHHM|nr:TetR/AcrR family transcriptional regulator [Sphingobium herbicidovorans]KFG88875.1 TetR-family transcriptional regulator [Sphingobium herbicidovorans NBRC 16415]
MGRRSDHSREELEALILAEGHRHMAEGGFAKFSSREVAKRIGYSVGTLYNLFISYDRLVAAINTRTFDLWAQWLEQRLAHNPKDRIAALVEGYFSFASENRNIWMAIYDHRLPEGVPMPEDYAERRARLTDIVVREVAAVLPTDHKDAAPRLARSLVATVHGHCTFALNGSFALLGETDPLGLATARVKECLGAAGARL